MLHSNDRRKVKDEVGGLDQRRQLVIPGYISMDEFREPGFEVGGDVGT